MSREGCGHGLPVAQAWPTRRGGRQLAVEPWRSAQVCNRSGSHGWRRFRCMRRCGRRRRLSARRKSCASPRRRRWTPVKRASPDAFEAVHTEYELAYTIYRFACEFYLGVKP
ncbi:hypothetical protein CFC21_051701 [Triticum aestivum]|uniref:Uncharacterized protein n=4 Tax=Triticum TaxID=4564 RepID=A0A9R0S9T3_TRITD|nr:hypothetical protein TRIUR3_16343 [Triticum urartu]KAF7041996.1 hypothetical protein CFC21_051701 [Triticum aestivum]VAH89087.1 unnamed protein product [Triticum turgidum subsp. durum]